MPSSQSSLQEDEPVEENDEKSDTIVVVEKDVVEEMAKCVEIEKGIEEGTEIEEEDVDGYSLDRDQQSASPLAVPGYEDDADGDEGIVPDSTAKVEADGEAAAAEGDQLNSHYHDLLTDDGPGDEEADYDFLF